MFVFSFKYLIKTLVFPVLLTDRTHSLFAGLRLSQPGRLRVGRRPSRQRTDSLEAVCTQVASL